MIIQSQYPHRKNDLRKAQIAPRWTWGIVFFHLLQYPWWSSSLFNMQINAYIFKRAYRRYRVFFFTVIKQQRNSIYNISPLWHRWKEKVIVLFENNTFEVLMINLHVQGLNSSDRKIDKIVFVSCTIKYDKWDQKHEEDPIEWIQLKSSSNFVDPF